MSRVAWSCSANRPSRITEGQLSDREGQRTQIGAVEVDRLALDALVSLKRVNLSV